jgi:choline dehydrogenase
MAQSDRGGLACDYLVVGGGSAGCAVAARLSEDPKARVLLLEAGGPDSDPSLHVPGAIVRNVANPRFNWGYNTVAQPSLAGRELFWPRGKVLGGSSTINGMLYVRGHRSDYDRWASLGCEGWSYDDVLPYFIRAERNERGEGPFHGADGPLRVARGRARTPICTAFIDAAVSAGYPANDDFNGGSQEGFGHFDCTVHRGRRMSTATAYLVPARGRANLTVITRAHVTRVVVRDGRAVGVSAVVDGSPCEIAADQEVILCGGAINTPQLLMLSGIGPADHLRTMGITPIVDAPEVGGNLQDHIAYKFHLACPLPVTAYKYLNPWHAFLSGIHYAVRREGVISHTALPTGGFFRTRSAPDAVPDIQVTITIAIVPDYGRKLPDRHGFTVYVNQGRPQSRGTIRLQSSDPLAAPRIDPNYLTEAHDVSVITEGCEQVREILSQGALKPYVSEELQPGGTVRARTDWEPVIRQKATTVYHPVGTCRMGPDAGAVVDPQLRVRGVQGLRLADASIMPTLMNGNTNAPTIMIAERAAALISGRSVPRVTDDRVVLQGA